MIREVKFESQDRRIKGIIEALNANGIKDIEEANAICEAAGLDPYKTCEETQPICFENAKWAYVVGCAIAIKKGCKNAADAAEAIGIGLQAFCIPGSVADDRKVGIGHGNLAAMLLREETKCFAFLAGHESFAAAEGAIKIAAKADKVRKEPLRCILNGLGKDAAQIISRINGFTYVQTQFDYYTGELKVVREIAYSDGTARTPSMRNTAGHSPAHWVQPMHNSGSTNAFMQTPPCGKSIARFAANYAYASGLRCGTIRPPGTGRRR